MKDSLLYVLTLIFFYSWQRRTTRNFISLDSTVVMYTYRSHQYYQSKVFILLIFNNPHFQKTIFLMFWYELLQNVVALFITLLLPPFKCLFTLLTNLAANALHKIKLFFGADCKFIFLNEIQSKCGIFCPNQNPEFQYKNHENMHINPKVFKWPGTHFLLYLKFRVV